jgi:hypothetical protein
MEALDRSVRKNDSVMHVDVGCRAACGLERFVDPGSIFRMNTPV